MIYYPKYHCEFNFIELTWGFMKSSLRRICTFTYNDLRDKVNNLLEHDHEDGIKVSRVQSFARFVSGSCLDADRDSLARFLTIHLKNVKHIVLFHQTSQLT